MVTDPLIIYYEDDDDKADMYTCIKIRNCYYWKQNKSNFIIRLSFKSVIELKHCMICFVNIRKWFLI